MVDDSELDYVRTFLGKVHTVATVMHKPMEAGHVGDIVDATYQKILVHPPEIMAINNIFITKRYKVEISETGEATLTTAINNIQIGCEKANRREAIAAWTRPTEWVHAEITQGGITEINPPDERSKIEIFLDVKWAIS